MTRKIFRKCLFTGLVFVMGLLQPASVSAQNTGLYSNRLDTLSFGERFAIKTNAFDWLILTPNIGFEFDLANRNWSKWTIGVYGRYNPNTRHPRVTYNVYDIKEVRAELRKYWRTPKYFAYYVGIYGSYDDYQIKFARNGYKGKGWMGGVSLGFAKRLYAYRNGSNVDFELGLNVGAMYTQDQKFHRDTEADRYVYEPKKDWHFLNYPVVNDLSMTFIYRFGPGIKDRYRKRSVVDDAYRRRINERELAREREARERQIRHDSIQVAKQEAKALKEQQKKEEAEAKAQLKAEKKAAKEQLKAEKAAQKAEAKRLKANKDYVERDEGRESVKLTKEEKKAQKAAEKAAKKAEKESTKAQLKANKEAAKAAKAAEKEAAKEAKAAAKRNR